MNAKEFIGLQLDMINDGFRRSQIMDNVYRYVFTRGVPNININSMIEECMELYVEITERENKWFSVQDILPEELKLVWISNGKGWTSLGCRVYVDDSWHWAESNGVIYEDKGDILGECESDDLDVRFWHRVPIAVNG